MITKEDYLTSSGSYPTRAASPELTPELLANADRLLSAVQALLKDLNIQEVKISSGFRPKFINAGIPSAAKRSLHTQCLAIDIVDDKAQSLCKLILSKPELLKKHGLWMEDPASTKGFNTNWTHLDLGTRADRPIRVFKP